MRSLILLCRPKALKPMVTARIIESLSQPSALPSLQYMLSAALLTMSFLLSSKSCAPLPMSKSNLVRDPNSLTLIIIQSNICPILFYANIEARTISCRINGKNRCVYIRRIIHMMKMRKSLNLNTPACYYLFENKQMTPLPKYY